jgi:hypothetical protein
VRWALGARVSASTGQPARGHPVSRREVGARFGGYGPTGKGPPGLAQGKSVPASVGATGSVTYAIAS